MIPLVTAYSVGIVTGMTILVALEAMGRRNREVDEAAERKRLDDELLYTLAESGSDRWRVN